MLGKAMLLLQGPGVVRVWGIYGLLVGCLDSLVRCCYHMQLQEPRTCLMLERGWGTWGSWWCVMPALGSERCLTMVAPGSCLWPASSMLVIVPGRVSGSCLCVCSLGMALSQSLDLDLHFKATSVGLWAFSKCVAAVSSAEPRSELLWVCLIREPALSRCRNLGDFLDLDQTQSVASRRFETWAWRV